MRIRQTIKKAVALGAGALMLGATILGASAANLSEYPGLFVPNGKVSAKIVVGEKAKPIDVVGAIDIAGDLQAAAVSKETVSLTGTGISVTGGKTKEVPLGSQLTTFGVLDDSDISTLKDEKISWNSKDIDVTEEVTVDGVAIVTSLTDEDFGADYFLGTTQANAITYRYIIDDSDFDKDCVTSADAVPAACSLDDVDTLEVEILGKSFEIQSIGADNKSVSMKIATEYYLNVGDTVEVEGKTVKLLKVGTNAVVVDVEGEIKTISGTSTVTVNGIKLKIESVFDSDGTADDSATLQIGEQITQSISNDESMEVFGEPDREADAEWLWVISADENSLTIGADFNKFYDADTEPVKSLNEKFSLPNDYASVYMASATAEADVDVNIKFEQGITVSTLEDGTDAVANYLENKNALTMVATDDIFKVAVNGTTDVLEETDTVYLVANATQGICLAYENNDGDIQQVADCGVAEAFLIDYEDTDYTFTILNATDVSGANAANLNMSGDFTATVNDNVGTGWIAFDADITNRRFGATDNEAVSGDILSDQTGISATYDNPYLTTFGVKIETPEDELDNDEFTITIPQEQVKINVVVVGKGGTVGEGGGQVTTDKVNPIGVDFGVLDKDAPAAGTTNIIVVGGPCVNTEAARLMVHNQHNRCWWTMRKH